IKNENTILTVSSLLDGEYGYHDVYSGAPTLINENGAQKIIDLPLNETESENLKSSISNLKKSQSKISNFFEED
ncbi:L-lactate dehydrogenase, partial [Staphylococcus epidermidis]